MDRCDYLGLMLTEYEENDTSFFFHTDWLNNIQNMILMLHQTKLELRKIKITFSKDQSRIVCSLSDVFEPLRTVIQCVHSCHVSQQSLGDRGWTPRMKKIQTKHQKHTCKKRKINSSSLMFGPSINNGLYGERLKANGETVLTCAVQMLLVALSLRMCCSLVCKASRYTSLPAASLKCKHISFFK